FVTRFYKPTVMLRYATQYLVSASGIADFAGNGLLASNNMTFTTQARPPLAPQDGFESVTDPTLGGVQVLSGAGAPTLTGARSLYIPPTTTGATTLQPQFLVRLALAAGDTVVRFNYRAVQIGTIGTFQYGATWQLGIEGGMIAGQELP